LETPGTTLSGEAALYPGGLHPIGQGVTAWLTPNGGWGESNAGLVCGNGASLLVDTLWDLDQTEAMLAAFEPQTKSAPIGKLVNTHADGDHWFGNELVDSAEIIATRSAARQMKQHGPGRIKQLRAVIALYRLMGIVPWPRRGDWRTSADYLETMMQPFDFSGIKATPATTTFSSKLLLDIGGRDVLLLDVGPAHTAGDLIVHVPDAKVVFAGDVIFNGITPVLWDGSARNWIKACDRILELKAETVVPGHGPITDLAGVEMMRKYWHFLRTAVRRHFEKGRSAYVTASFIAQSDEFHSQPFGKWAGPERMVISVHCIYRRLLGRKRTLATGMRLKLLRQAAVLARELGDD